MTVKARTTGNVKGQVLVITSLLVVVLFNALKSGFLASLKMDGGLIPALKSLFTTMLTEILAHLESTALKKQDLRLPINFKLVKFLAVKVS